MFILQAYFFEKIFLKGVYILIKICYNILYVIADTGGIIMSDVEKNATGALKVSREVIADIVSGCVKETEGVSGIALKNKLVNKLANTKKEESIKIALIDDVLSVSFGVIIKNGFNAVKTAETIQENVKNAVASMLGLTVAKVNINIVNVEFSQ